MLFVLVDVKENNDEPNIIEQRLLDHDEKKGFTHYKSICKAKKNVLFCNVFPALNFLTSLVHISTEFIISKSIHMCVKEERN